MGPTAALWLAALGLLVALLIRPRPLAFGAAVAVALLVGWPLHERGFWANAVVAAAAAIAAAFAARPERAISGHE